MNALHLIRTRDAAFTQRMRRLDLLTLTATPGPLLVLVTPAFLARCDGPVPPTFLLCLLAGAVWPILVAETAWKSAARLRIVGLALALAACGATPARPVPRAPPIPTTAHETWRCVAPGAPVVLVVGTPEPARVEVGDAALDCYLVPLGGR